MANCSRCGRQLPPFSLRKICQWCVQHEAAQRGEGSETQVVQPMPWVRRGQSTISLTQILFGANIAVFIAMLLASGEPTAFLDPMHEFSGPLLQHWGANQGPLTLSGDWWRLLTYMFVHGGLLHIGFNMWCLWDLGALSESLYGRWTYLVIYLTTGVAGGLASLAWHPFVPTVGASGAIFGLAGALIASFYLGEFSLPKTAIKGTLTSLLVFAGFNLFFGGMFPGVDNSCHIGGLLSGLIMGALVAKLAPHHDTRRVAVLAVFVLVVVAGAFGVAKWRGGTMRFVRAYESLRENAGDSLSRLQDVAREQPNSVDAHFGLAEAYFNRHDFPHAEAEFKRILELQPQLGEARFDLGITYLDEKKLDEAKSQFTQLLAQDSGNAGAHYGLGLVSAGQGNDAAALEQFKSAAASNPKISGLYFDMGNSYARLGKYDDAIAAYLKEKNQSADDADLENALADAYQAKGMTQQAQEARNRAGQLKGGGAQ
jgi:membrane associated rhomboid family serine protease/Tfp pilus assembly protein PilF